MGNNSSSMKFFFIAMNHICHKFALTLSGSLFAVLNGINLTQNKL